MTGLEELTSRELRRLIDGGVTSAVVPFGSVEAHGGHLPLGCDALLADIVAAEVALRIDAIVAPTVRVGYAADHVAETGTVTIAHETLTQVAVQIGQSLFSHGFRRLILVSTHGGNQPALQAAVDRLDGSLDGGVACAPQGDLGPNPGKHSGRWLTSVMLAVAPDRVAADNAEPDLAEVRAASTTEGAIALERFIASIVAAVLNNMAPER
jgi:creatinine amidohydrolase